MIKLLIRKLFKVIKGERKAPPIHYPEDQPKPSRVLLSKYKRNRPVNMDQINIDCSTLLVQLTNCGYEPVQIMQLLAKIYGAMMAAAPDHVGITTTGDLITTEMIENEFFLECKMQRDHFFKLRRNMFGGIEEVIGKGTVH